MELRQSDLNFVCSRIPQDVRMLRDLEYIKVPVKCFRNA